MSEIPRRQRILAFAVVAAVALVATAYFATLSAPAVAPPDIAIANVANLEIDPGAANAIVFPFQLAPSTQSDDDGAAAVSSASITATLIVPACQSISSGSCPGVFVEVVTPDQLPGFPTQTNVTPLWCTNASGGACSTSSGGTFGVDLTAYAGQPLDLVVWSPGGIEWANLAVHGTWSE